VDGYSTCKVNQPEPLLSLRWGAFTLLRPSKCEAYAQAHMLKKSARQSDSWRGVNGHP